ncbi:YceI family protein [Blastococcus sp. TML/M2B]|uniref:YceI family protein n=1 Tax=unclassified Blastococcus TaxID=2619396 RepID=UPI00190D1931|nr:MULTISPECIES: YceI family protein [unclassified Blastococcus]MBN1093156.1 YceI family protein [Blastococcus sp. TML/M2B]MBN1096725.1 YceI family protein [Blastococcus sp. TML/C7B]
MTAAPRTAIRAYRVSDSRTQVRFTVRNVGIPVRGSIPVSRGEVHVDAGGAPVRARAEFELAGLDTGITRRDADLRRARFLSVDRQPVMVWSCERFTRSADGSWLAEGRLTVRGTATPLAVAGVAEPGEGGTLVRAAATLDRTAVGIRAPRLLVGRVVRIEIDAWLVPLAR